MLDRQRLGKQRVENLQISRALLRGGGWAHHPVTLMWRGHLGALLAYQRIICWEWTGRGYRDTCLGKMEKDIMDELDYFTEPLLPPWFGDVEFHLAHQSNLVRKDRWFYGPKFPGVPDDLPYIYPKPEPVS